MLTLDWIGYKAVFTDIFRVPLPAVLYIVKRRLPSYVVAEN